MKPGIEFHIVGYVVSLAPGVNCGVVWPADGAPVVVGGVYCIFVAVSRIDAVYGVVVDVVILSCVVPGRKIPIGFQMNSHSVS